MNGQVKKRIADDSTDPRDTARRPLPGGWTERQVRVGRHVFDLLLPADPNQLLDQLEQLQADDPYAEPYWAALWPAAPLLAERIVAHDWPPAARAIELGCGVGLAGLAGLAAGLEMTFSDAAQSAVDVALDNARRNGFPRARGRRLDWRQPQRERFQVVLACDVLYDFSLHACLLDAVDALLAPAGLCWIGDPGRSTAPQFVQRAEQRGYHAQLIDEHGEAASDLQSGQFRVIVLRAAR